MSARLIAAAALLAVVASGCTAAYDDDGEVTGMMGTAPAQAADAVPVVIDTDLAPDDLAAITYLVRHPRVDVVGITVPATGMVGCTEEELTDSSRPYVVGIARWTELARGLMTGDETGMLKLLVDPTDRRVLGVHVIGTGATELVHIGQAVMAQGAGGLDFLVTAVFNYPTFAESYKVAALDAANRIRGMNAA